MTEVTLADLLIIEDDLDSADALSLIMQSEGHDVRVGYNGEEGLRMVQERPPDLVLLDVCSRAFPIWSGSRTRWGLRISSASRFT